MFNDANGYEFSAGIGIYDTPDLCRKAVIGRDFAFVADDGSGLHTLAVFQRFVDADGNRGQSLAIEHTVETFVRVRLSTVQEEMITYDLGPTGGQVTLPSCGDLGGQPDSLPGFVPPPGGSGRRPARTLSRLPAPDPYRTASLRPDDPGCSY